MAKLLRVTEVSLFTRNQKLAKEFYTKKLGLTVRDSMPKFGYLALGATKGGEDAGLSVWQPDPAWGQPTYEEGLAQVGTVTGIGFATADLDRTVAALGRRGVKIELEQQEDYRFARITDPDGNILFLGQDAKPKVRRVGIRALDFVTVVTRDVAKAGAFFTKALGFKGKHGPEGFSEYRLSPKGTAIAPFTPSRAMYDNPSNYDADMAHVGEETGIGIEADDVRAVEKKLLERGVRFKARAEERDWGSVAARIYDADGNSYMIYTMTR